MGEIIAFLDVDDLWDGEKLAVQIPLLLPPTQIVWGRLQEFRGDQQQRMVLGDPHHGPHVGTALMRRTAFEHVGLFDESMRHGRGTWTGFCALEKRGWLAPFTRRLCYGIAIMITTLGLTSRTCLVKTWPHL